jgi:hypothetical protein
MWMGKISSYSILYIQPIPNYLRRKTMPELRFSAMMLSKIKFWRKPVRPTLRLSKAALETPLPEGFLSNIRGFLTRSGSWKGHPTDSVEAFMTIPAPGVSIQNPLPSVIGIDEPVFTSLGFGMEGIKDGVVKYATGICEILNSDSQCDAHICITQAAKLVKRRRPQSTEPGASQKNVLRQPNAMWVTNASPGAI